MQGHRLTGSGEWKWTNRRIALALVLALVAVSPVWVWQAAPASKAARPQPKAAAVSTDPIIAGFAKLGASGIGSVADAVDQVIGKRGYLSHDMQSRVGAKSFVGRAATALVKPASPDKSGPGVAAKHSVEMIDEANPGDVGVIVMEGTLDVAAIGNLMATAAKVRGMAGMVLDGAVRDIPELREIGLPVFARSVSPGTAVSRYASVAKNIPVESGGVTINPGDIIVAGEDGVVVVPKDRAAEVLKKAQELDDRSDKMVPYIKKFKSLQKAIEQFKYI